MFNSPSLKYTNYNRTIQNNLKVNPNYSMQNPNLYYMPQQKINNLNNYNINKLNSSSLNRPIKTFSGNAAND